MDGFLGLSSSASIEVEDPCFQGIFNESQFETGLKGMKLKGHFDIEIYRPDGTFDRKLTADNNVMLAGLDDWLNVYLRNGTPKTAWYCLLVDNAGFTTLANADTMTSHAGWAENQNYSETVRQTWAPAASSGQNCVNGTQMTFTLNATVALRGIAIVSDSTKGGTSGLLLSSAAYNEGVQSLASGSVAKVTYSISAAS